MARRMLVVAACALAMLVVVAGPAAAQELDEIATLQLNIDVVYYMVAIVLVFIMQAGFAMLESGLTRSKNAANIMMKNLSDMNFGIIAYFLVGFGLMYGATAGGFIGTDTFALAPGSYSDGITAPVTEPGGIPLGVDFMYQAVFAATAATIVSGAIAGRMKFSGYVIMSVAMTIAIYPIVGHWQWGGGWLSELGYIDFAGSSIVHLTGGVAAITVAAILGPRRGKFAADGSPRVIPGHNAPMVTLGTFLLFFGWFGFNGGSVLAADGVAIAPVLFTTALAGCAGGAAASIYTWIRFSKPDLSMTCNGVLAGLVGITAGPDLVGGVGAIGVGLVAGVLVILSVQAVDRLGIDDAVGAFSVHGVCGVLGCWWLAFYGNGVGLFTGNGFTQVWVQVVGTLAIAAFVCVVSAIVAFGLKAAGMLRVSEEEEVEGLDIHEHGMYGYPELALGTAVYPAGPATSPTGEVVTNSSPSSKVLQDS
ncbi:MAG TPA: ammonium transporter [Euzebyales bacterium]|nr:ammonium transporter [Euzebyales bacterium]